MLFSGNLDMSPNSVIVFCTEAKDLSSDLKPTWMLAICCVKSQAACSVTRFLRWQGKECVPFRTFSFHLYFLCLVVVVTAQLLCPKSFLSRLSSTKLQSLTLACPHT